MSSINLASKTPSPSLPSSGSPSPTVDSPLRADSPILSKSSNDSRRPSFSDLDKDSRRSSSLDTPPESLSSQVQRAWRGIRAMQRLPAADARTSEQISAAFSSALAVKEPIKLDRTAAETSGRAIPRRVFVAPDGEQFAVFNRKSQGDRALAKGGFKRADFAIRCKNGVVDPLPYIIASVNTNKKKADKAYIQKMLRREVRICSLVKNLPNIATVLHTIEADGHFYFVMPYFSRGDLRHWLRSNEPPSPVERRSITSQILNSIAAVHGAGIIHRDIKTENFFVDAAGNIKLADFGLSCFTEGRDAEEEEFRLRPAGSEGYIPPDRAQLKQNKASIIAATTQKWDVWSAGVVLCEVNYPDMAVPARVRGSTLAWNPIFPPIHPNLSAKEQAYHKSLQALIGQMLSADPGRRPSAEQTATRYAQIAADVREA